MLRNSYRVPAAAVAVVAALGISFMIAPPAQAAEINYPPGLPASADPLADRESEAGCDPTAKPGTLALRDLVVNLYPFVAGPHGIIRECSVGDDSGHKLGRALDWSTDVNDPQERAAAAEFTSFLLADDPFGNPYGGARRMGIMYMIWNRQIWGSYVAGSGWRTYTGENPHTDHVHFSMSRAGSQCNTSWWEATSCSGDPPGPPGWSNIVEADLDGDGDDELGFYRNLDGRLGWYEMTANGGLGSSLSANEYSPRWTEMVGADFDGDGDDEVGFYRRSDGRWQVYEMAADGNGLGGLLTSRDLSPTWDEITAADLDGDGDDEVAFYRRSDGRWQVYEMAADGNLGGEAMTSRDISATWHEITAGDTDGDGDDEVIFYRRGDGRFQAYEMTAAGGLGTRLNLTDIAVYWNEIVSADFDGNGDDEAGFYRSSDGRFLVYQLTGVGGLGDRINTLDLYP